MNVASHIKLVIFDVDGTLVTTRSGATFRKTADDWQWLPGRLDTLKRFKAEGIKLGVASNQGGVAFGYLPEEAITYELIRMGNEAGIDMIRACYTHPHAGLATYRVEDPRRKPEPGMLQEIMEQLETIPQYTLMVGDREEDRMAAHNAEVAFMWAEECFT